ncbi:hypothetical protein KC19_2G176800 [Ceratodon purpureus]|uniref:GDP-Man:Man(3)GlcNAc(2)-PP-Dol alpha-1,2-mannosyltransferase n=1 Tax=Ceratodon purpureus TaxID=3225 RepID=A0A8T0IYZ6_CERPU|nr:hypothetical protein KC19_2G176800 [Ceratodon purpureus]
MEMQQLGRWLLSAGLATALLCVGILWTALVRARRGIKPVVAFFHPYTNDGGGGERVLWCAVRAIQEMAPGLDVVVYTGDLATPDSLAARALDRFGVKLVKAPQVVKLERRKWVEAKTYPRFTIIGQSLGSIILAWEALSKLTPLIFLDTSGYAFTYMIARAAGSFVVCYTHYPTISTDMLERVRSRASLYNNDVRISRSFWLSSIKVWYYRIVAQLYGLAGRCAHLVMVNSSWTRAHINAIWKMPDRTFLVYPPCNTLTLQALPLERPQQNQYIVSVAQFRPEKAHELQLEAFALALEQLSLQNTEARLKLVGSCRNQEDNDRVESLRLKCRERGLEQNVDFCLGVSNTEMVELLGGAIAGLHTMTDEHFGIVVVEYMASGAVPIAHNSAGPKLDIVVNEGGNRTGFLASSVSEFADAMCHVVTMPADERMKIAQAGRVRAARFSESKFDSAFKEAISPILEEAMKCAGIIRSG